MSLKTQFLKFIAGSPRQISPEEMSKVNHKLVRRCPVCDGGFEGHTHWRLATVFLDDRSDAPDRLEEAITARDWAEANTYQQWAGDRDEREYHILQCPVEHALALFSLVSTSGMWSDDSVENVTVLGREDARDLFSLAGDQWQPF